MQVYRLFSLKAQTSVLENGSDLHPRIPRRFAVGDDKFEAPHIITATAGTAPNSKIPLKTTDPESGQKRIDREELLQTICAEYRKEGGTRQSTTLIG
jgi:hypothetical protein